MAGIKLGEQLLGGRVKIGTKAYDIVEIQTSEGLIWPIEDDYIYVISNVYQFYQGNLGYINAAGQNYCYFVGNVRKYIHGVLVEDLGEQQLTPVFVNQSQTSFYLEGKMIKAYNRGKIEGSELRESLILKYRTASVNNAYVVQQANIKTTSISEKEYGQSYKVQLTEYRNYEVSLSADKYISAASPCPASGGICTLIVSGKHEQRGVERNITPWDTYNVYSWTSGESERAGVHEHGEDIIDTPEQWSEKQDTPTLYSEPPFEITGSTLSIPSEARTEYPAGRTAKVYAYTVDMSSYQPVIAELTIYQQYNILTPVGAPRWDIVAIGSTFIPFAGGTKTIRVSAYDETIFTSGDAGERVSFPVTLEIINGSSYAILNKYSTESQEYEDVILTVDANTSSQGRNVTIRASFQYVTVTLSDQLTLSQEKFSPFMFIAREQNSTISISNHDNEPLVYRSFDGENWAEWDYSPINLADGQILYLIGDNPNGWSKSDTKYSSFQMTGGSPIFVEAFSKSSRVNGVTMSSMLFSTR